MNTMRNKRQLGTSVFRIALAAVFGLLVAGFWITGARGAIVKPLYVGNVDPIRNEYGQPMPGSRIGDGETVVSRVEIRQAHNGLALPPPINGEAHAFNPLVQESAIGGIGLNAMSPDSGLFAMLFRMPPDPGTKVFARVYNAPTAAEASFYVDSGVVEIPENANSLLLEFSEPQPIDNGDDDGDGLNNSWERSLGTADRATADYDGDGMSDLDEMRAGTSATNAKSLLAFEWVKRADNIVAPAGAGDDWQEPIQVRWQSVPGKQYQLEYVPTLAGADGVPPVFGPVGAIVTAGVDEVEIEMLVEIPDDLPTGTFRVRLVTED